MLSHYLDTCFHFSWFALLMAVTPGVATALVIRLCARHGKKAALGAAAGIVLALVIWGIAATFGVGAILKAYPQASVWVGRLGCLYLAYLAVKIFVTSFMRKKNEDMPDIGRSVTFKDAWRDAFILMILCPEICMYDAALFPKFILPSDNMFMMGFTLTVVEVVVIGLWYCLLAFALSSWRIWREPKIMVWIDRVFGVVLLYLAIKGWK